MTVSVPLEDLEIPSLKTDFEYPTERHQLAMASGRLSQLGFPISVRDRLSLLARRRPDDPGYLDARSGESATWKDLAEKSVDWTGQFSPGTTVGLLANNPIAFCESYLAGLASGVCIAPLDPRATGEELGKLLDVLEIVNLVVDPESDPEGIDADLNIWVNSPTGLARCRRTKSSQPGPVAADVLLTTSGTTGRPKVVPLTEAQLLRVATRIAWHNELTPVDRGYCPLPLCHVNAQVVGVLATLVAGSSFVVEDRFHRADFWAVAEEMEVSWLNLVPAIIGVLGNQPPPKSLVSEHIRFARSASSPLPRAVQDRFETMSGIGILDTYGMTEAASQIAANPIDPTERRLGSVGRPIGVTVRIVDDDGNNVATGEVGNVEIDGPDVIDSYLGQRATLSSARNACGWLHTGDMGWHDADGYLYLEGRRDDRINRGGEKIYPREIEDVLGQHPLVANAVVVGRPHSLLGSEAVACIQSREHLDPEAAERLCGDLTVVCARSLSRQKRPASIFVVDSLPSGPTGKVARLRLQAAVIDGTIETRNEW